MTWREALLSLQLASEEKVGAPMRNKAREARTIEDAAAEAVRKAVDGTR